MLHNPDPNLCLTPHWFWALLLIPTNWAPDTTLSQINLSWLSSPSNDKLNSYFVLGENITLCQFFKWKWIKSFHMKGKISIIHPVIFPFACLEHPLPTSLPSHSAREWLWLCSRHICDEMFSYFSFFIDLCTSYSSLRFKVLSFFQNAFFFFFFLLRFCGFKTFHLTMFHIVDILISLECDAGEPVSWNHMSFRHCVIRIV